MHLTVNPTTADILDGLEDLRTWDDDEIARGQRKGKGGRFHGSPPKVVPNEVHEERIRRTMKKAYELLKVSAYDAVVLLRDVVKDEEADVGWRVEAAKLILDRVLPKTIDLSLRHDEPGWMMAIRSGVMELVPGYDDEEVIDVETVEDEPHPVQTA